MHTSRDYSQALDVGTLSKGLDSPTIRLLVWILGFMSFGYATGEFEVISHLLRNQLTIYRLPKSGLAYTVLKNILTILKTMRITSTPQFTIVVSGALSIVVSWKSIPVPE